MTTTDERPPKKSLATPESGPTTVMGEGQTSDRATEVNEPTEKKLNSIEALSKDFGANISSLRAFAEKIGPIADEHDRDVVNTLCSGFLSEFGLTEVVKRYEANLPLDITLRLATKGATVDDVKTEPPIGLSPELRDEFTKTINEAVKQKLNSEPAALGRAMGHVTKVAKMPPRSGAILREGALLVAVSYLDVLISRLVHLYYKQFPGALPSENKLLSLSDLREIGSIDAAEDYILGKRVEALLRKGLPNNLRFFSKKLNVDLSHFDKYKALILETFQRRHLLVHNGGIVNKQYLAKVDEGLVKEYALSVGNHILVSDQYLRRAIDRVHFTGVFLLQQCWRQWFKADASNADVALNTNLFDAIAEARYKLAQNLGDFARTVKISENATAMNILLNVAQSYKWDGNEAKCLDILNSHDWSGCGLLFKLALFALKGDADAFYELLPLAIAAKEIKEDQLREWPVFHGLRESPRFEENMARVVGQAT